MRFGLALPHYGYSMPGGVDWPKIRDVAQMAEELGYGSLWVSDHLFLDISKYGGSPEPHEAFECFTTLAALAQATTRVRLGTLVVCNDLRNPALVAKMAASIDVLSEGRFDLGMGAGWYEPEYEAAGISFDPPGVRVSRLAEAVQIVKGMLSQESLSFEGQHYRVTDAVVTPRPAQPGGPPVWVGGKGDRVVSIAGRHADGFNTVWAWTPEDYRGRVEVLDEAAKRAGRQPVRRTVGLYTLGADDPSRLEQRWSTYVESTPKGVVDGVALDEWSGDKLVGTADQIAQTVGRFEALGVEEVILGFGVLPFQLAEEQAPVWFAEEVFPRMATTGGQP